MEVFIVWLAQMIVVVASMGESFFKLNERDTIFAKLLFGIYGSVTYLMFYVMLK